jgi:hypothetical protein
MIIRTHIVCKEDCVTTSTKTRISRSISRSKKKTVFLREDFDAFGTPSRVTRAISELIEEGRIVRIGYGVYSKARKSVLDESKIVPVLSLDEIASEALIRLGANPGPGAAARRYNTGETTQIPMKVVFSVTKRINRKLSVGNQVVRYEITHA